MFFWFEAALGPAECALQHQEFAAAGGMQTLGGRTDRELGVHNPSESSCCTSSSLGTRLNT